MRAVIDLGLDTLRLEQDGRVLTAYYSNPPSNYVKAELLRDLDLLTHAVEDDNTVGAVVIASEIDGRFLSHVDANELEALSNAPGPELVVPQALLLWKVMNAALGGLGAANVAARAGHVGAGLLTSHRWKKAVLRMNRSRCVDLARKLGAEILGEAPHGREFRVTIDASGRPGGLRAALRAAGPAGICHSFGISWQDVALPVDSMFMKGVTFTTGRANVRPNIPDVLALIADGTVDPLPVYSDIVSFDDAPTALAQGLRKPLVVREGY